MDDELLSYWKVLFVLGLGWIYWLARFFARGLRKLFVPFGYYPLLIMIILWARDFIDYGKSGDCGFSFMPFLWQQFLGMWQSGFWRGCGIFILWGWIHFFAISLAFSSWNLERKTKKMRASKAVMDRGESRDVLGLDLVTGDPIPVSLWDVTFPLQVLGPSGVYARSVLQKALEADVKYGHSVVILASETQKDLLREVTYVLRERGSETDRAFFYFSLKEPDLSASYSPFHGKGSRDFLRAHLKLDQDGIEAGILDLLMRSLEKDGKPYVLEDLLLLLKDKRAAMALNEIDLTREYLWRFDSLRKASDALAKKLTKWGHTLRLEKYPMTQGYPLDIVDILNSGKHLLVELESKSTEFLRYFLSRLLCELTERMRKSPSEHKTVIYLFFPEDFMDEYPIEPYLENLSLEDYRIFSSGFSPLYREKQGWNTVFLPDVSEGILKCEEYKRFQKGLCEEKNRLWGQWDLKALMNEATVEASSVLLKEIGGVRVSVAFMTRYDRYRKNKHIDCRFFYVPGKDVGKAEYAPYQKRYKPENMLNLCDRARKIKADILRHDPRIVSIIQDLKPKEPAQS